MATAVIQQFVSNATSFGGPQTYWESFDEVSRFNVQLNIFEKLWAAWYLFIQNDVLATGIMSFTMHELVCCHTSQLPPRWRCRN